MYAEATTHGQHHQRYHRDLENVNPIYDASAAATSELVGNEVVRQVWVENRTLKKRIHQLEDELAQYKSQTAEQLERCRRQIEGLSEKLEQAKSSASAAKQRSRTRDEAKSEAKRVKEEKASKKASSKAAKKAKTSKAATAVRVTPLVSVPPPPAPPPAIVIEVCAPSATSLGEAKKNLKRRAPDAKPTPARLVAATPGVPSLNEVLQKRNALRPATTRPKSAIAPVEDEFKAALLKKFENVNIYSPCPPPMDVNDSFADPTSPYRPF